MFKNKRALVTGASRGIGLAVADAFLENGADVSILASSSSVHSVAEELGKLIVVRSCSDGSSRSSM